jgi:signal transduction histidine kinase
MTALGLLEQLAEACRVCPHPVALLDDRGAVLAAAPSFPRRDSLPWDGPDAPGFAWLHFGGYHIALCPVDAEGRDVLEQLTHERRHSATLAQRHGDALASVRRELELLSLLEQSDDILADSNELGAGLCELADLVSERLGARPDFALQAGALRCDSGAMTEPAATGEPMGPVVVQLSPAAGVVATASITAPLDVEQQQLLDALVARIGAAGVRRILEDERRAAEGERLLTELSSMLAHEANSPLAALSTNLGFVLEELEAGRSKDATAIVRDALTSCLQLITIGRQLGQLSAFGGPGRPLPEPHGDAFVIGDPAMVRPGFDALAALAPGARVELTGIDGRGFLLSIDRSALILPPVLVNLGVEATPGKSGTTLRVPFRMLPL